jgi:multidrug/hemolysin transport system ATP-binding protein
MADIISVNNLTKTFGDLKAVDGLSFAVPEESFFAFLGQNGAGKSTTINMLVGLLAPDGGEIRYGGGESFDEFKSKIGIVFQNNMFDELLTVRENLMFYGALLDRGADKARYAELVHLFGLEGVERQRFGTLSGGQKRKAEIARAMWGNPKILFLDEPTTGLDPKTRREVWELLRDMREKTGMTIFLTTHYMEETEGADEVTIIHQGKKIAAGSPATLKAEYSRDRLMVTPKDFASFPARLDALNLSGTPTADNFALYPSSASDAIDILNALREEINYFEMVRGSMDDVFLTAVGEVLHE